MVWRGLLLFAMVACCHSAATRDKRTLSWLFGISGEPQQQTVPIYKVHRYSGIQLVPIYPGGKSPRPDVPEAEGNAPDILNIPDSAGGYGNGDEEEAPSALVSLGSLASLLPSGGGFLSSALSLSGGSSGGDGNGEEIRRIGLAAKKQHLLSLPKKKIRFLTGLATGAVNKVVSKGKKTKNFVKGIVKGGQISDFSDAIYHSVPIVYPKPPGLLSKIPIIGKYFGYGSPIEVPEIHFPFLPQLSGVPNPPDLPYITVPTNYEFPYKTGFYVKVKVPKVGKYEIPSTSYGEPLQTVPVPESQEPPTFPEEGFQTGDGEVTPPQPEGSFPYPPSVPEQVPIPFPPPPPPVVQPPPPTVVQPPPVVLTPIFQKPGALPEPVSRPPFFVANYIPGPSTESPPIFSKTPVFPPLPDLPEHTPAQLTPIIVANYTPKPSSESPPIFSKTPVFPPLPDLPEQTAAQPTPIIVTHYISKPSTESSPIFSKTPVFPPLPDLPEHTPAQPTPTVVTHYISNKPSTESSPIFSKTPVFPPLPDLPEHTAAQPSPIIVTNYISKKPSTESSPIFSKTPVFLPLPDLPEQTPAQPTPIIVTNYISKKPSTEFSPIFSKTPVFPPLPDLPEYIPAQPTKLEDHKQPTEEFNLIKYPVVHYEHQPPSTFVYPQESFQVETYPYPPEGFAYYEAPPASQSNAALYKQELHPVYNPNENARSDDFTEGTTETSIEVEEKPEESVTEIAEEMPVTKA